MLLIVLSNYFYSSGENVIAAFLPELARGEALGRVSGWGWSLGYLGGLLALGLCLGYVTWAQAHGQQAPQFVPATMLITAGLFVLASPPTFIFVRERARRQPDACGRNLVVNITAAVGAFFFGNVQDRLGHVPTIALTLAGWR